MMRLLIFGILNFGALALGSALMISPVKNVWYQNLDKAPWTPPGWVFGAAWFSIMVCFSVFLWKYTLKNLENLKTFYAVFAIQWLLNVLWNPIFFRWQMVGLGLFVIVALTLIVFYITYLGFKNSGSWGALMLPYALWLLIAVSLNAYILINN